MKTFKTPKGTELPLRDFRGKDYLDVQYRVLWMREEHPDWGIETEFVQLNQDIAIAKATIRDGAQKLLAQGTKAETPADFKDFIEKAETGAVGRALALCGYGTQFAQEMEEGERVVDGPREAKQSPSKSPGDFIVTFGKKFRGTRLADVNDIYELADFSKWIGEQKEMSPLGLENKRAIDAFLATRAPKH
jgi:hypothetical protein